MIKKTDDQDPFGSTDMKPPEEPFSSLKEETVRMENSRRELEQSGHRNYARVNAKERIDEPVQGDEPGQQQTLKEHPLLNSQRFDGIDPSLNPNLMNNPDLLWVYEQEKQKQELEKQLRLGNELQLTKGHKNTPKPSPF